jgi:uncharacterized cupin superfamily protein
MFEPRRRHPNVINADEVPPVQVRQGKRYAFVRRQLGVPAGARALGASLMELPPHRASWPVHFHCANEEAIFVLQGTGKVIINGERVPIRAGDYVTFLTGPDGAHQVYNDAGGPLVYLAFSTMSPTDISVYPDSDKVGVFGGAAPGGPKNERYLSGFFRRADAVDYWDGEDLGQDEDDEEGLP